MCIADSSSFSAKASDANAKFGTVAGVTSLPLSSDREQQEGRVTATRCGVTKARPLRWLRKHFTTKAGRSKAAAHVTAGVAADQVST